MVQLRLLLVLPVLFVLAACTASGPTTVTERQYVTAKKEAGKKVVEKLTCVRNTGIKIVVGKVRCKAAACKGNVSNNSGLFALLQLAGVPSFEGIGDGLKDMMLTALRNTGCFRIFDRESMEEIQKELKLAGINPKKRFEAADYLVVASITSISYSRKSGSLGGGFIPLIGAISTTKEKAHLAMDVRLISVKTGEIVFSKTYQAESGKTSYGVAGVGFTSGVGFGGALSGLSGTAMEEVARDIIIRATYDIARFLAPKEVKVERVSVN